MVIYTWIHECILYIHKKKNRIEKIVFFSEKVRQTFLFFITSKWTWRVRLSSKHCHLLNKFQSGFKLASKIVHCQIVQTAPAFFKRLIQNYRTASWCMEYNKTFLSCVCYTTLHTDAIDKNWKWWFSAHFCIFKVLTLLPNNNRLQKIVLPLRYFFDFSQSCYSCMCYILTKCRNLKSRECVTMWILLRFIAKKVAQWQHVLLYTSLRVCVQYIQFQWMVVLH